MERRLWTLWMTVNITIVWTMKSTAESCPAAIMKVSPSTVIHHGDPVNLTCTLSGNAKSCNPGSEEDVKIKSQNTYLQGTLNTDSVTVQDLLPPPGETTYICWKCKTLCVISVFAGFPPDQPRSVTCEQEGEVGRMSCSWESGRETFIETTSTVQLLQKTGNVTVSNEYSSQANQSLPVTIAVGVEYTVLVETSNQLGTNVSVPYRFTYIDAVKPYPPSNITVTCDTSHDCTVTMHAAQDVQHFRLRYRIIYESIWEQIEVPINRSITLHSLRPLSQYELQAACKYKADRGKWSNWSNDVTFKTPEDAPRERIEVWYKLHRNNETVTIFWKYMNLSAFRGQIQFYQVIFQNNERHGIYIQNTTDTRLSRNIDQEGCVITVSAHNSMGSSPPTSIRVTTYSLSGLPAPTNVVAIASSPENFTIRWELPPGIESAGDQIVAWEDPTGMDQSHTNWITVPKLNRSVTISGHLKPYICYQIYVYLLWEGRAGLPGITQGSTKQTAPLMAPEFQYEVHKENRILVTWTEIPAKAQMGCITHYSIYLRAQTTHVIKISSHQSTFYQYEIENIEKDVQFSLEMTCSNEAGESPPSALISVYVRSDEDITVVIVIVVVVLLFIAFLFSILFAKQRVQFLSKILPHWWNKPVPDPANCEWAKKYISNKEKREILTSVASSISNYENETETLVVEEITSEEEEEEETLSSVFSYKIDMANISTRREDLEGMVPALTRKCAQGVVQNLLDPDHSPLEYQAHQDIKLSNYLVYHDIKPSHYLSHHVKPSNKLAQNEIKLTANQVQQDINTSDYLVHQDMKPSHYLSHHVKPDYRAQYEMKLSDSLVHHEMKSSDSQVHHGTPFDYLAHHEIKPSDYLLHQNIKLLNSMVSHIKSSAYLVHNNNKMDYLPTNILTVTEGPNSKHKDLFHQQILLPAGERTNTISLDTVQVIFPSTVQ